MAAPLGLSKQSMPRLLCVTEVALTEVARAALLT